MREIILKKRYPHSREEDITDAFMRGYEKGKADRPQGEWIWHEDEDICNCSECEFEIDATGCIDPMEYVGVFRYCPNCGARMRPKLQGKHFDSIIIDECTWKGADDESDS